MNEKISKFKTNNEIDMERIINEYSNYLSVVIKNICDNFLSNEDIEEILLDVFLALWKNREKLDEEKPIKPYISSIAHNLTKKKMSEIHKESDISPLEENTIIDLENFDFIIDNKLKKDEVEYILNELSEEDYQIFTLFYYNSYKVKQIASKLGISAVKVKTKLCRIRKKIKKKLKGKGYSI